jgi:hypothetical protein
LPTVAPKTEHDSAEVYIGEEFIGVLFLDDEDDDKVRRSHWCLRHVRG